MSPVRTTWAAGAAAALVAAGLAAAMTPAGATVTMHRTTGTNTLPFSSYAITPSGPHGVQLAGNVDRGDATLGGLVSYAGSTSVDGTAINATGKNFLISDAEAEVQQISIVGTAPVQHTISLSQFDDELTPTSAPSSQGVAVGPGFALVTVGEQGVVQLREHASGYAVDSRVKIAGLDQAGHPHAAGFIPVPEPDLATYDGVAVSRVPLPNGEYRALVIDRDASSVQVIDGVGTATPKLIGRAFTSPAFADLISDDGGTGGMAFSPATPDRAFILTPTGVDVLNLTHPTHPTLQNVTTVGTSGQTSALAVSANGSRVALATNGTVYIYAGIPAGSTTAPLRYVDALTPNGDGLQDRSLAYTRNGRLLVEYDEMNDAVTTNGQLDLISDFAVPKPTQQDALLAARPFNNNAVTIWPLFSTGTLHPASLGNHLKVGKLVKVVLSVSGGIGQYSFRIIHGSLPRGLRISGHLIRGTPKRAARRRLRIRAVNPAGGAVFGTIAITVKKH